MTDSYHFQIEPEPRVEVPKFRVGGHYRQNNGAVVKLLEFKPGLALAERVFAPPGSWLNSGGARRLSDGIYPGALRNAAYECHLIPGELILRDGQWVAADSIGPFPSGATLTVTGGYITGRVDPEPQRAPLPDSDAWRYTGKERDDFPDFTVTSSEAIDLILPANRPAPKGSTLHAHPGKGSALLRG